jgi:BASS family bile acid:Na+ symporter
MSSCTHRAKLCTHIPSRERTFTAFGLTYANLLIALGPTFYVLWHNLRNSWQLHRHREP